MKKILKKDFYLISGITFILLLLVHIPLMTKNIITADGLLNNYYYNGYSWELSLGRFGLYLIGILKSFISIPHLELILSYLIISLITYLLIKLFNVEDKINKVFIILFMVLSPIISANLVFAYCSVPYLLAFFLSILSIYLFEQLKNKYLKTIIPIILMVISLSMYQAYLSLIITVFMLYTLKKIFDKEFDYKLFINYLVMILISIITYFISMKLSQIVFHINMADYSNASSIGINTILTIPSKIIDSYKLTYNFLFTDQFMKNIYMHNNIINLLLVIIFIVSIVLNTIKNKLETKDIIKVALIIILLPIFLNSVIFVISDTKLQLLMSSSYLLLPIYLFSILDRKYIKLATIIISILLLRNYSIQVQSTYLTLENTFNTYHTVINEAINRNIDSPNNKYIIIGKYEKTSPLINNISKSNYGYISDEDLFWDEHNLRKIAFERFVNEYFGLDLEYATEEEYNEITFIYNDRTIKTIDNIVIINFNNYNKLKK